jgi:hypothetical protein
LQVRAQSFLNTVAAATLTGQTQVSAQPASEVNIPLPLHARNFLKNLSQFPDAAAVAGALRPLLQRVAEVSRLRRAAVVAGCLIFPLFACFSGIIGITVLEKWNRNNPGLMELSTLLQTRTAMTYRWVKNQPHPSDREFAVYIAHHYRRVITNDTIWSGMFGLVMVKGDARRFAEQSVSENPAPTEKEIAAADAALKNHSPPANALGFVRQPWFPFMIVNAALAIYVAVPALIAALLFRGGLVLLLAGVSFVRRDGARASRLRVLWRAMVAWSPMLLALVLVGVLKSPLGLFRAALIASLLVCALTIFSIALPRRGLPDRLAGTWPVPR